MNQLYNTKATDESGKVVYTGCSLKKWYKSKAVFFWETNHNIRLRLIERNEINADTVITFDYTLVRYK